MFYGVSHNWDHPWSVEGHSKSDQTSIYLLHPPVASAAAPSPRGPESQRGSLRCGRPGGVSNGCWGSSPQFDADVSGDSSGSPASSPLAGWVSGLHCFCRPGLRVGPVAALASSGWLQRVRCCLPHRGPPRGGCLAAREGCSGLRLALQDPAAVSLASWPRLQGRPEARWGSAPGHLGRGHLLAPPGRLPC